MSPRSRSTWRSDIFSRRGRFTDISASSSLVTGCMSGMAGSMCSDTGMSIDSMITRRLGLSSLARSTTFSDEPWSIGSRARCRSGRFSRVASTRGWSVSYMAEAMSSPVRTTTVGFGGRGHNEIDAAALTAAKWGTTQLSEIVEPRLDEVLDPIVESFDEPFADSSAIPTFYVSKIARRQVTVALSGDGGDETFGGYSFRYVPHAIEGVARRVLPGRGGRPHGCPGVSLATFQARCRVRCASARCSTT